MRNEAIHMDRRKTDTEKSQRLVCVESERPCCSSFGAFPVPLRFTILGLSLTPESTTTLFLKDLSASESQRPPHPLASELSCSRKSLNLPITRSKPIPGISKVSCVFISCFKFSELLHCFGWFWCYSWLLRWSFGHLFVLFCLFWKGADCCWRFCGNWAAHQACHFCNFVWERLWFQGNRSGRGLPFYPFLRKIISQNIWFKLIHHTQWCWILISWPWNCFYYHFLHG